MLGAIFLQTEGFRKQAENYRKLRQRTQVTPHVPICIQKGHYTVKTAETRKEKLQAYCLRYDVFHKEYMGKKFPIGFDRDRFDNYADHLVIIDERTKKVVGTYRFICSEFSTEFYSADEFDLSGFIAQDGIKLELSRACIAPAYRKGIVMALLWKGLGEYMKQTKARFLFGCSSVQTVETLEIFKILNYLQSQNFSSDDYKVRPTKPYSIGEFDSLRRYYKYNCETAEQMELPPLMKAYFRAGAKVLGEPALDRKFRCTDFFTVLDVSQLTESVRRRFVGE